MDRYSGCGCCCVNLVVDDDNESRWDRTDDSGVATVTILQAVKLNAFMLGFAGTQPAVGDPESRATFDGTARIYILDSPSDANIDAIGVIEYQNENARSTTGETLLLTSPNFANLPNTETQVFTYQTSGGVGEVDVPDIGITETIEHFNTIFSGMSVASFDNILRMVPRYQGGSGLLTSWVGNLGGALLVGGPAFADVQSLGSSITIQKGTITDVDQLVFLRYETTGDFTLPETKFMLKTLNSVGDRSCRTESVYYDPTGEAGNCTTPPIRCDAFPKETDLFLKVHLFIEAFFPGQVTIDEDFWLVVWSSPLFGGLECSCEMDTWGDGTNEVTIGASITCESGVPVLTITLDWSGEEAVWEVELTYDITQTSEIPNILLEHGDAITIDSGFPTTTTLEINP